MSFQRSRASPSWPLGCLNSTWLAIPLRFAASLNLNSTTKHMDVKTVKRGRSMHWREKVMPGKKDVWELDLISLAV